MTKKEYSPLTESQQALYDFYVESYKRNGFYPTVRESMEHFGFRSTNAIHEQIRKMEKKGWLENTGRARAIKLYKESEKGEMEFFLPRPIPERPRTGLTRAQRRTYDYLVDYFKRHGFAPSQRDVCNFRGAVSTNTVKEQYVRLQEKNFVRMIEGKARTIILLP